VGPSLSVWTDNDDTETWFDDVLLHDNDYNDNESADNDNDSDEGKAWWSARHAQSRVGILVQVPVEVQGDDIVLPEKEEDAFFRGRPRITELLIYGSITDVEKRDGALTPPTDCRAGCGVREMRVHALPLSSDLLYCQEENGDSQCGFTPLSPASDGSGSESPAAYFIPPLLSGTQGTSASARKRQRVVNLLDDAALRHKKVRRKGGEAVGKVLGGIDGRSSLSHDRTTSHSSVPRTMTKMEKEDDLQLLKEDPQCKRPSLGTRRSGSSSVSSFHNTGPARPPSRRGLIVEIKRSSLHRVDSIVTANDGSPVPDQDRTIEQRNKDALSRTIMAGMRLYGLQQKKKTSKSRAASEVPSQAATPDIIAKGSAEDGDEYKLVYHQTLKGAAFALRRDIANTVLPPAVMREVADKLLTIFCSNPCSENDGALTQGFSREARGPLVPSRRPTREPG